MFPCQTKAAISIRSSTAAPPLRCQDRESSFYACSSPTSRSCSQLRESSLLKQSSHLLVQQPASQYSCKDQLPILATTILSASWLDQISTTMVPRLNMAKPTILALQPTMTQFWNRYVNSFLCHHTWRMLSYTPPTKP
ncbi:hypothetical protein L3X38_010303 [Prunus dulcis]|uniref:Uncharacterized protein n=1 Tax=Prunus dulcis TaxID=3755 RepID=A0AAD4ZEM7_PRUDU|nr:hypothetical protein L3X38_010303 [Prunus dulcis]